MAINPFWEVERGFNLGVISELERVKQKLRLCIQPLFPGAGRTRLTTPIQQILLVSLLYITQ